MLIGITEMKISVITICYNTGKYIERAISSVLKQDYNNWEHIVIDGGSQDETIEILNRYEHLIWISEPDKGQSDAMNKGFNRSSGDIIIYLNADDELNSGLFSVINKHFRSNRNIDILVMNLLTVKLGKTTQTKPSISLFEILRHEGYRFPLNPVSYAYRRNLQAQIGLFPIDNYYAMDYWFLIRAYLFGDVRYIDFVGGTFYFDGKNKSANLLKSRSCMKRVRDQFLIRYFYKKPVFKYILKVVRTKIHYLWLGMKKIGMSQNS
jgi:glycosyltransferase involved in cell wall biosynthesis